MEITFVLDQQKKMNPADDKDRRAWQSLRNKNRPGTRFKFKIFHDRSTAQHRMYRALLAYGRYASEAIQKQYPTEDAFHSSKVWEFCMMHPEHRIKKTVWYHGEPTEVEDVFSTSPNTGTDSEVMNEYVNWFLDDTAKALGVTVAQMLDASEKHRKGIDE